MIKIKSGKEGKQLVVVVRIRLGNTRCGTQRQIVQSYVVIREVACACLEVSVPSFHVFLAQHHFVAVSFTFGVVVYHV